jgi:hypothetical protein
MFKYLLAPLPFFPFVHLFLSLIAVLVCITGGEGVIGAHIIALLIGFPSSFVTSHLVSTTSLGVCLTLAVGFTQWVLLALMATFIIARGKSTLGNPK